MSRNATIVQVFIASPSDVSDERDLLASTIEELNRAWSRTLGIIFEVIRWEDNVRPGFGADPQSVINDQIGDEYDVFIGVLWGRFGTPTQRASSGTMEEFDRAYERYRRSGTSPQIMIYFKDQPLPPSKIDPGQLEKILEFRKKIESEGVYSVFDDAASFESSVRAHLSALAQQFSRESPAPRSLLSDSSEGEGMVEDDLGYLDYIEIYQSRMSEMTATVATITKATNRIGEQMSIRASEFDGKAGPTAAKSLIKKSADDLESYADILSANIPLLSSSREASMSALSSALVLQAELEHSNDQLNELRGGIVVLQGASSKSRGALLRFRNTISAMPRMTSDLNKAKRKVVTQLDLMDFEYEKIYQNAKNIIDAVDRLLDR